MRGQRYEKGESFMIAGFIIWSICALLFFVIGLRSRRSKKAAGFWANAKAPEVTDVRKYNHAVSNIWFVLAAAFELLGIPLLFLKQNSPMVFLSVIGVVFLLIGSMTAYVKIENTYRKK